MDTTGRKLWDGKSQETVVPKLEAAFAIDATVAEACFYAGISTSAYYRFVEKYPQFRDRFARLFFCLRRPDNARLQPCSK